MADDRNAVENQVRRRLTEAAAAGGVPHSRASLEVLYLLPEQFLREWVALFDAALKLPDSPAGKGVKDGELGKAGSGGGTLRGTHKGLRTDSSANAGDAPHLGGGAPKKGPGGWHVRNVRALEIKGRMDKRLRNMAREIRRELAGEEEGAGEKGGGEGGEKGDGRSGSTGSVLSCSGCGRMAQREWNWCPHCGGRFPQ